MAANSKAENRRACDETDRDRLHALIHKKSFRHGVEIKLASGKTSDFYFNMKPTMMDAEGAALLGRLLFERIAAHGADLAGGVAVGSVPLVSFIIQASALGAQPLDGIFIRAKAKDHGTQMNIEGLADTSSIDGKRVIMVEDATTTGGSVLQAIGIIRASGGIVDRVITVVDRLEGATDTLAAEGIELEAIFTAPDFLPPGAA